MYFSIKAALAAVGAALALSFAGTAAAQGTIKIAYTDPLSGPFAQVGDANLKQMNFIIDFINSKGGALGRKFELVPFDNKSQPSDALLALKSATDQNMPFIMQCSGSNIAAALMEGIEKHNDRNPDNRIIYLNCGAVATELTNEIGEEIGRDLSLPALTLTYRVQSRVQQDSAAVESRERF